jgi:uncharacterized membrane protein YhhN
VALKENLGKFKLPVILYLLIISTMVALGYNNSGIMFAGALLFYFSDALLAWNKFVKQNSFVDFFSISAYYLAQLILFYGFTISK